MLEQNFTQFCKANDYTDDYSCLNHAALSPSGHMSKRSRDFERKEHLKRIASNLMATDAYRLAVLSGDIIDPSGAYDRDSLLEADTKRLRDKLESSISSLNQNISFIESLGSMSHKKNGELKIGHQRTVDHYNKQKAELVSQLQAL
jgi:hypothetical protein